jgi:hypothetical protein
VEGEEFDGLKFDNHRVVTFEKWVIGDSFVKKT